MGGRRVRVLETRREVRGYVSQETGDRTFPRSPDGGRSEK